MRILLVNPPGRRVYFRDGYCSTSSKSGYAWHPLDLLVLSGILTGRGHQVAFVDAIALQLDGQNTLDRAAAFDPRAVIGLAADVSWPEDVRFYRRLARRLDVPLLLSGDLPRFEAQRAFDELPSLQAVITDFTTDGAARFVEGEGAGDGLILRDGTRCPSTSRRWSSPPARHDLVYRRGYRLPFHGARPYASVLASYGCPFSCSFCNTGLLGFKLRAPEEVEAEVRLVGQLGYQRMYLRDATANGQRAHWLETCRAIRAANTQSIEWNVFCTFRPFDAQMAHAMADAGCRVVQFGIETASASLRAETGKAFDNEAAYAAVRYAHEAGMRVCGHFVLGLPGQSAEDVRATGAFARDLQLDWASFNLASARPGTPLRTQADALGLSGGDASTDGFIQGLADVPAKTLRRLKRQAMLRFYLRPRPLSAIAPDLTTAGGWAHLYAMGRAALKTA